MAAYSGTPTVLRKWELGDRYGKAVEWCKDLSITLSSQGGATNTIGKVALGYSTIYDVKCILFTDGSSQKRAVVLFTDGTNVYVGDPTQATDANRFIPADVTGTLVLRISGKP
jgi:hypothetical protein